MKTNQQTQLQNLINRIASKLPRKLGKKLTKRTFEKTFVADAKPEYAGIAYPLSGKELRGGRKDIVVPIQSVPEVVKQIAAKQYPAHQWICYFHTEPDINDKGVIPSTEAQDKGVYTRLILDVEIPKTEGGHNDVLAKDVALKMAQHVAQHFGLEPYVSEIVYSGGGAHIYINLKQALNYHGFSMLAAITKANVDSLREKGDTMAAYIDTAMFNAVRIVRMPGTWNHKYGQPVATEVVYSNPKAEALDVADVVINTYNFLQSMSTATNKQAKRAEALKVEGGRDQLIDTIKANVRVIDLVDKLDGLNPPVFTSLYRDQYNNPITGGDTNPSFAVYHNPDGDRWIAFNDGHKSGDVIDLVEAMLGTDTAGAIKWIAQEFGIQTKYVDTSQLDSSDVNEHLTTLFGIGGKPRILLDNFKGFYTENDRGEVILHLQITVTGAQGYTRRVVVDRRSFVKLSWVRDFCDDNEWFEVDTDNKMFGETWPKLSRAILKYAPRLNTQQDIQDRSLHELEDIIMSQAASSVVVTGIEPVSPLETMRPIISVVSARKGIHSTKIVVRLRQLSKMIAEVSGQMQSREVLTAMLTRLGFQQKQIRVGDLRLKGWILDAIPSEKLYDIAAEARVIAEGMVQAASDFAPRKAGNELIDEIDAMLNDRAVQSDGDSEVINWGVEAEDQPFEF